jgi:hypothetical protein
MEAALAQRYTWDDIEYDNCVVTLVNPTLKFHEGGFSRGTRLISIDIDLKIGSILYYVSEPEYQIVLRRIRFEMPTIYYEGTLRDIVSESGERSTDNEYSDEDGDTCMLNS